MRPWILSCEQVTRSIAPVTHTANAYFRYKPDGQVSSANVTSKTVLHNNTATPGTELIVIAIIVPFLARSLWLRSVSHCSVVGISILMAFRGFKRSLLLGTIKKVTSLTGH